MAFTLWDGQFAEILASISGVDPDVGPTRHREPRQLQRRLDDQEQAQLLAAYDQGVMINDLGAMFDVSRVTVMATLNRLGAESRRGIVQRRIEEARSLYDGWKHREVGDALGGRIQSGWPCFIRCELFRGQ